MSQENVEIVRSLYGEFERGNFAGVINLLDPDAEWHWLRDAPTALIAGKKLRSREQIEAEMLQWMVDWEWFSVTGEEFIDAGDRVVVTARTEARLRDGRGDVQDHHTDVVTVRTQKVARIQTFDERFEALQAAGLRE